MSAPAVPVDASGQITSTTDNAGTAPIATIANSGPSANEVKIHTTQQNTLDVVLHRQYVITDTIDWAVGDSIGAVIWSKPIHPQFANMFIKYFQRAYNTWGGGFDYRVQIAGTGFHAGKLGLYKVPPNYKLSTVEPLSRLSVFPHVILDPKQLEAEFVYGTDQRYANFHWALFDEENPASFGGYMALVVMVPLNTSASGEQRIGVQIASKASAMFTMDQLRPPIEPSPTVYQPVPQLDFAVYCFDRTAWYNNNLRVMYTVPAGNAKDFAFTASGELWRGYQTHNMRDGRDIFGVGPSNAVMGPVQIFGRQMTPIGSDKKHWRVRYGPKSMRDLVYSCNTRVAGNPIEGWIEGGTVVEVTAYKTTVNYPGGSLSYDSELVTKFPLENVNDPKITLAIEAFANDASELRRAIADADIAYRLTMGEVPISFNMSKDLMPLWQTQAMHQMLFSGVLRSYDIHVDPIFHVSLHSLNSNVETFIGYVRWSNDGIFYTNMNFDVVLEDFQSIRFRYEQDLPRNKSLAAVYTKEQFAHAQMAALATRLDSAKVSI